MIVSVMHAKSIPLYKALEALATLVCMLSAVVGEVVFPGEGFSTLGADVGFVARVQARVAFKVGARSEGAVAYSAGKDTVMCLIVLL